MLPGDRQAGHKWLIRPGYPWPMGVYFHDDGFNFTLYSRHAERVWLEFYETVESPQPLASFELHPSHHRTGDIWHIWIAPVSIGQLYGFRVDGPYRPHEGHRFNRNLLLLDPYARQIAAPKTWNFQKCLGYRSTTEAQLEPTSHDDAGDMPKSMVIPHHLNREFHPYPRRPWSDIVIYEIHVKGFTIDPSSRVHHPGTFRGLIEKLPYLEDLGITAIELMPIFEFNEDEFPRINPLTGDRLKNFWGYNPVAWFALKTTYSTDQSVHGPLQEFQDFVEACHARGIEVILDVVYNHTAEGDETGPTLHFRGIDNTMYYLLEPDRQHYLNYSGTGNTLNTNHPVLSEFIIDSLRYWASEMRVDGFRFDLASVMSRDQNGHLQANTPLLERIAEDPVLRDTKIIAEAWDAAGAYQVGHFSETRWAEWNGRYRDDIRRFWRGDAGLLGAFVSRLCGSEDLYARSGKGPENSINFITSHDGFTLNDLVSYDHKHNEMNAENNADGVDENFSANYGHEGTTDDPNIEAIRARQLRNFMLTLLLSRGVPMLLGGDEFRRTQQGNNNAWCQDNLISWVNWDKLDKEQDLHRLVRGLIRFRKAHPVLSMPHWYTPHNSIDFCSPEGKDIDWNNPENRSLTMLIYGKPAHDDDLLVLFNASTKPQHYHLPTPPQGGHWHLVIDTAHAIPSHFYAPGTETSLKNQRVYTLESRASALFRAVH